MKCESWHTTRSQPCFCINRTLTSFCLMTIINQKLHVTSVDFKKSNSRDLLLNFYRGLPHCFNVNLLAMFFLFYFVIPASCFYTWRWLETQFQQYAFHLWWPRGLNFVEPNVVKFNLSDLNSPSYRSRCLSLRLIRISLPQI